MKTFVFILSACLYFTMLEAKGQSDDSLTRRISAMTKEKDPFRNVVTMHEIIKDNHLDPGKNAEDLDMMNGIVALSFLNIGDFQGFDTYIKQISNKFNQTSYLNMAADMLFREKKYPERAEAIARQTVELYDTYKDDPSARPGAFPKQDWERFIKMAAYPYYCSYAMILHANGKDSDALYYLKRAIKDMPVNQLDNTELELYTQLLAINKEEGKAYQLLMEVTNAGKATRPMKNLLRELYVKRGGDIAGIDKILDSVGRHTAEIYTKEIEKRMMAGIKAPDFILKDVNGKQVSLHELKGKVVVLDFWATWCVPCIASMPAMEKVAEKHTDVVFLYIATQEKEEGALKRITDFMEKHAFRFRVLLDSPAFGAAGIFPVAAAYKLQGIPARVVIDRNGMQRFISSGYTSDEEIIQEMESMITLAKAQ